MIIKAKHLIGATLFMAALSQALSGYAQWVSTGGPLGGLGYDVRIHPQNKTIMYVTDNYAGVVVSNDAGATWRASNQGITVRAGPTGNAYPIFSLTVDPNNPNIVWAGTNGEGGQYGVFKSTDGGATWSLKTNGIPTAPNGIVFRGFTVQVGNSDTVYAMAELPSAVQGREFNRVKGQVFKTTDGGQSWNLLWQGDNLARYLIVDPTDNNTLYLSTGIFDREAYNSDCANAIPGGVGVVKSTDGGSTWTSINSGLTNLYVGSLRMHPTNRLLLFAAAGNNACSGGFENNQQGGLFRTTNGGASWSKVIANDILTTVNFAPANPEIVYAGSAVAFYRSSNGGLSWTTYSKPGGASWGPVGVRAGVPIDVTIDPADVNLLYANNYGGGVFRSSDGAQTWAIWSKGYSGAQIHAVHIPAASASSVLAIGRSGPFRSTNFGGDWTGIGTGQADFPEWNTLVSDPRNANIILMADEHQGKIMRSTDGGAFFIVVLTHPQANAANVATRQGFKTFAVSPSNPDIVYAGLARERGTLEQGGTPAGRVVYKSTNDGQSFVAAGSALDGKNVRKLIVHPTQPDTLWAATSGGVYKSSDGAASWSLLGLAGRNIPALAVDIANNTLVAGEKEAGIWTSEDGGSTWTGPSSVGFNNANPYVMALSFKDSGTLYAADYYSGTYSSTDHGRTWSPFPDTAMSGLTVRATKDIVAGNGLVYVATEGGGVLRYGTAAVTSANAVDIRSYIPAAVASSNYQGYLRVINTGTTATPVSVAVIDGTTGVVGSSGQLTASLPAGAAITFSAQQVETALGQALAASSRPRIRVTASSQIEVQSFMSNPGGVVTQVSDALTASTGYAVRSYVPAANAPAGYTSFIRVINIGTAASPIQATLIDDTTGAAGASGQLIASLPAGAAVTFSAQQVETALGASLNASSRPRISITAVSVPLEVQSFIANPGGAVTQIGGAQSGTAVTVRSYIPAANASAGYSGFIRIINTSATATPITLDLRDGDTGALTVSGKQLVASLPAGAARTFSAQEIETALGVSLAASARPRIQVSANVSVDVQSFMSNPGGTVTQLSGAQSGSSADVRTFIPAANAAGGYASLIRVINTGTTATPVSVAVIDGATGAVGTAGQLIASLPGGAAVTFTAQQVETALGAQLPAADRSRIRVTAAASTLEVQSFMSNPGGVITETVDFQ